MGIHVFHLSVWVMAAVGIVGNLLVLFGPLALGSRGLSCHIEHTIYLRHLAASDLLMGIYLAIIATADIAFRGEYLLHEEDWRHSGTCSLCGFLSTLSCLSSTLFLTLITWDRLVSVTRPLLPRPPSRARYFSWFHLCRAAMYVRVCEPRGDGISSDKHLLDNPVLRGRYLSGNPFKTIDQRVLHNLTHLQHM
uniref:G-protein coupled receptors family 1 profile domain-containing protein n=1 Tax=Phlebotomus papatasi TaxID=29031 RepID=A0A1B0D8I8_PHLPP